MSSLIKKILLLLALSVVTLPALAENSILIVGDSLSTAYGIDQKQSWMHLFKQRLRDEGYHYQVVNISSTGATTSNGLSRMPQALKEYQPAIVIIALGGNDGLRGLPIGVIEKNLNAMVVMAKAAGSKVLIVGVRLPPNYGPQYTSQFQKIFASVADANDVLLVPMVLKDIAEKREMFQADGIHPTAAAQQQILNNIWAKIKPIL